jgi:hypothetical protein
MVASCLNDNRLSNRTTRLVSDETSVCMWGCDLNHRSYLTPGVGRLGSGC